MSQFIFTTSLHLFKLQLSTLENNKLKKCYFFNDLKLLKKVFSITLQYF